MIYNFVTFLLVLKQKMFNQNVNQCILDFLCNSYKWQAKHVDAGLYRVKNVISRAPYLTKLYKIR